MQLVARVSTAFSFLEPEILALPQSTLDRFAQETPGLQAYSHELHDLSRKRPHVRSAEVEAVLAAVGEISEGPDAIFSMIDNADLRLPLIKDAEGNEVQLTKGNYLVYLRSADRRLRKQSFDGMHSAFLKQRNTNSPTRSAQLHAPIFQTRQRGYATCRERALSR